MLFMIPSWDPETLGMISAITITTTTFVAATTMNTMALCGYRTMFQLQKQEDCLRTRANLKQINTGRWTLEMRPQRGSIRQIWQRENRFTRGKLVDHPQMWKINADCIGLVGVIEEVIEKSLSTCNPSQFVDEKGRAWFIHRMRMKRWATCSVHGIMNFHSLCIFWLKAS